MALLVNPATGTVVSVQGDLETRYRARGWAEHNSQPEIEAIPEEPAVEVEAETEAEQTPAVEFEAEAEAEIEEKPATRSNTKRNK